MASLNRVALIGRLGKDPETKSLPSGGKVCQFSLATSETWKKDGEKQERTTWHNIVIWNEKIAEVAQNYLKKGSQIYLEGQIESREYEKDGQKRQAYEIVIRPFRGELTMLDSRNDGATSVHSAAKSNGYAPAGAALDDSIEF